MKECLKLKEILLMKIFLAILFIVGVPFSVFAQCSNSLQIKSSALTQTDKGVIKVEIITDHNFKCSLFKETGEGLIFIERKENSGKSLISFHNVDSSFIYTIEVEFASVAKLCRKLQRSQIILK